MQAKSILLAGLCLLLALQPLAAVAEPNLPESATEVPPALSTSTPAANMPSEGNAFELTPAGKEAATLIGVLPEVKKLMQYKQRRTAADAAEMTDDELAAKVRVLDRVMGASLEVRMVSDRIDRDLSWSFSGKDIIDSRRQRNLNLLFATNFAQSGILGVLSGPVILAGHADQSTELLLIASSIGLLLSSLSFIEAGRGSKPIDGDTNALADFFNIPDNEGSCPTSVKKFMNSAPPGSKTSATRWQILVEHWKHGSYLRSMDEQNLRKLSSAVPAGTKMRENSALVAARMRMLFDTQSTIEQLDTGLLDVMRATSF
ncbi:MAG TPA: hypothetical protein V6C81_06145 [Planktothrix sp.]|jgi:hypothetical protein